MINIIMRLYLCITNSCIANQSKLRYRGFHEKGTFSVHSFNDDYLSIPERPGSYKYLFHEISGIIATFNFITKLNKKNDIRSVSEDLL